MATRTTRYNASRNAIADPHSITREPGGRQIDWDSVPDTYEDADTGFKVIPAFKIMSALPSGQVVPRADAPGDEEAVCVLETDASEGDKAAALSGYGTIIGGVLHDNLMPDAEHASFDAWWDELNANGTGFARRTYEDSRAS